LPPRHFHFAFTDAAAFHAATAFSFRLFIFAARQLSLILFDYFARFR
jgi:hypothetical protein